LPVPPENLRLGYEEYLSSGEGHVKTMFEIIEASDFSLNEGNKILDLGCGAGRMIRHLKNLSAACEIWGTDISAEHIYWCKQNLSPPFNFATTTKIPHLPFEDRYFNLIYCGSLFTHIDDLAEAWLLELRRILSPNGRLYITIHDNHTMELFDDEYSFPEIVKHIKSHEIFEESKDKMGMLSIGRDDSSQVFYDIDYFTKTLNPMFEILSITQEAYYYQTAILLKRKSGRQSIKTKWKVITTTLSPSVFIYPSNIVAFSISAATFSIVFATIEICSVASFQSRCSIASRTAGKVFTP